ncbi:MAG TPA: MaoC family dehydratase [Propionibacteriaceae bacterium]
MAEGCVHTYSIGDEFTSSSRTITETDIVNYVCLAGLRLPIFIDEEFSRKFGPYGTRVAPGPFTVSMAAGMIQGVIGENTVAALGMDELEFKAPVRAGDTLHTRSRVLGVRRTRDRRHRVLKLRVDVFNQTGQMPCSFTATFLSLDETGE